MINVLALFYVRHVILVIADARALVYIEPNISNTFNVASFEQSYSEHNVFLVFKVQP